MKLSLISLRMPVDLHDRLRRSAEDAGISVSEYIRRSIERTTGDSPGGEDGVWVCVGSMSGWCGTRHRSREAAVSCCEAHREEQERRGGASDRTQRLAAQVAQRADGVYSVRA